ncbi:Fungal Zn2-Cys6 binuclear cluster domain containing protein [Nitzschia inconspicua]|uniref:Fungal Zn2-Cys6 binuclear cluster domain containing protein n=1 Tax=Nitzschia inconspicua TaxID=303405 RepID=A0A9K3LGJ7_9STRA|nr:Fungal Zn2-Cys6 binuclear cluster domain containing protein [Nitzschia inconspicua]
MPACVGCHKAKVKCDLQQKSKSNDRNESSQGCSRCQRLSIVCVRHISRQGQRPNSHNNSSNKRKRSHTNKEEDDPLARESVDCQLGSRIVKEINPDLLKRHYGVKFMIHHWTSLAFARRSFSLLSRASQLAAKADVSMDTVFSSQRREALDPLIWQRNNCSYDGTVNNRDFSDLVANNDNPYRSPLQWSDIPHRLRQLSQMPDDPNNQLFQQQRYFWVRESKDGRVRFLVSQAFSDEIASQRVLDQTFQSNKQSIIQLLTEGPADTDKFTGALQFCLARYTDADTVPIRVRANGMKVRYRSKEEQLPENEHNGTEGFRSMDMLACLEIVALDHSFHVAELVLSSTPSSSATKSKPANGPSEGRPQLSRKTSATLPSLPVTLQEINDIDDHVPLSFVEDDATILDDLEMDGDLQQILDLISD